MTVNYHTSFVPFTKAEAEFNRDDDKHEKINLHPDGQPWTKCCGCKENNAETGYMPFEWCAYRRNGEDKSARVRKLTLINGVETRHYHHGGRFVCAHRTTEEGFHRVCAGWHNVFGRFLEHFHEKD